MKPSVRLLSVSAILVTTLVLAYLPVGIGGQNQSGPEVAHAQVLGDVITYTHSLFGNSRVTNVVADLTCSQDNIFRIVITQTVILSTDGSTANGEAHAAGRCTGDVQAVHAALTPRTPAVRFVPGSWTSACATITTKDPRISIPRDGSTESMMFCGEGFLGDQMILVDPLRDPDPPVITD